MPNMKSVIQNNTNLLSKHTTLVAAHSCSCCQKSVCPLNNECLSESLVFKAAVSQTPSQINNTIMELVKKLSKNVTTILLLHLGI